MSQSKIKAPKKKQGKKPRCIFQTVDIWGSDIHCTQSNWDTHVVIEHPELIGREADVQKAIEDPDRVVTSTKTGIAFAFERVTTSDTVRAIVYYEDPAALKTGRTKGALGTAYVVDTVNWTSRVGAPVYQKPTSAPAKPSPIDTKKKEGKE